MSDQYSAEGIQKAIRIHGAEDIRLEDISSPKIENPDDAIVKVLLAGLCGSDLHIYRGREGNFSSPFVMGHELYGEIVALGPSFGADNGSTGRPKGYSQYKVGMKVFAAFSVSCLECEACSLGQTSRCTESLLFGSPSLSGAQAQFVRIPKAGGTLIEAPVDENTGHEIAPSIGILLADILPTGYFAAKQALEHPNLVPLLHPKLISAGIGFIDPAYASEVSASSADSVAGLTFAVIGLGPVGVCALVALIDRLILQLNKTSTNFNIMAIDLLESRRVDAMNSIRRLKDDRIRIGSLSSKGNPGVYISFLAPADVPSDTCVGVLEVVGHPSSLSLAATMSKPFGVISSVGVHSFPNFPIPPPVLYNKNLSFAFGRCPVRALLPAARSLLARRYSAFEMFVEKTIGFSAENDVKEAYVRYNRGEGGKICFDPWR
ncbi:hypothetical protein FRC14_001258 [Serendipita sp. 396]|nr:hypothetical protein FRC14_001258 [Serendipita sp. 396]KAG8774374.1 hypothetical protein FRC15_001334 [Serendipita sp. 397]KAG8853423.1 hypothetical protein FRC20_001226 [Serendipita sp. 405]